MKTLKLTLKPHPTTSTYSLTLPPHPTASPCPSSSPYNLTLQPQPTASLCRLTLQPHPTHLPHLALDDTAEDAERVAVAASRVGAVVAVAAMAVVEEVLAGRGWRKNSL